ncbi:Benzoyl-CoA reductase subunit BadG [Lachnospiraceae bacterium TWA4]|nr:Benzoyl-CoA reductase subunit BadG [Lachnospiraceae bacterium TWA4]
MFSLGIDSGSTTTKAVLFDGSDIVETKLISTSANPKKAIQTMYEQFDNEEIGYVITTGYGRNLLENADKKVTEITCHARGAKFLHPQTTKIIDVGGQDSKVIVLNSDHQVEDFLMNDKCAAGTGRFIEMMMQKVEQPLDSIDDFAKGCTPIEINSMCAVFAESEVISLLAQDKNPGDIVMGVIESISRRVSIFSQKLTGADGDIFFSGGLAGSTIFKQTLEKYLKCEIYTHELSQYAGAIGAALIAYEQLKKQMR